MSTARTAQFRSAEAVIDAYEKRGIPNFSVWCGKDFNFSWVGTDIEEGAQKLDEWLTMLQENMSTAIYSLRVYEDPKGGKIMSNTPYDGSFNFVLNDRGSNYIDGVPGGMAGLHSSIKALHKRIDDLQGDGEADPQATDYGMGKIGLILQHPTVSALLPIVAGALVDKFFPKTNQPVPKMAGIAGIEITDQQLPVDTRINAAIDQLQSVDPNIVEVLCKLARLSRDNPAQFNMYLTMFRQMPG